VIPHLYHVIPGGRYQRQAGQHFDPYTYDDLKTIAVHRHYAGDIRAHAWWGQEPEVPQSTLDAGGGHAHCGAMVYLGDNWPESYRNQIFMHNIHGNRINQDVLAPTGSGYVGNRAPDVLLANDKWFRGISLKYGPDGGVWLIDWYDRNACHRRDPEIWDRTNGRVYKVTYGAEPDTDRPAPSVHLAGLSDLELAELHEHRNDWYVRAARRLLQERAAGADVDPAAIAHLSRMLDNHQDVSRRLRALWTLHTVRGIDDTTTQRLLADSDPHVRAWSIRLAVEDRQVPPAVLKTFAERAHHDPSAVVRLALAAALQRLPASERWEIAAGLVGHAEDAEDHNLPLMIWYGVEPLVAAAPDRALALVEGAPMSLVERHALRRASTSPQALEAVVAQLLEADTEARQSLILSEMLQAFRGRANLRQPANWGTAYAWLSQNAAEGVREQADQVAVLLGDQRVFPRLRAVLADRQMERNRRRAALDTLVSGRDAGAVPVMHQLLEDVSLRGPAIRALAMFDDPATPGLLLSRYAALPEADRRDVISTLCTRVSYARPLLEALEAGRVPRTELHAYNIAQLLKFDDESLQARIQQVWGAIRETSADRRAQIDSLKGALSPNALARADRGNGRRLFDKNCATCHRLFGEGQLVGPDLTGSNRADLDYILSNVVDPSAVLGKDYRQTVLVTSNGQVVSGLLMDENDSAVTIRTINDTVVVPKADIEERSLSDLSMMPERLLDPLPGDEIRDLVAYLSSPAQVPLSGPKAPIAVQSGRVPDALEGESLTVLRKTAGNPRNQSMAGFSADRWSGADHLWWTGAAPGARLELEIPVATAGRFQPEVVMTKARDYGIVQLTLDGQPLGGPIDLFNFPDVITTGVLTFPPRDFSAGQHVLTVEIVGAHERATKSYLFGLDYIRLSPASGD
jgi:putative heme-binding domain-containing protein